MAYLHKAEEVQRLREPPEPGSKVSLAATPKTEKAEAKTQQGEGSRHGSLDTHGLRETLIFYPDFHREKYDMVATKKRAVRRRQALKR